MLLLLLGMQSFGEHGRELITPEVGLRLLEMLGQLGSEMEDNPAAPTSQQKLLQRTVFKVRQERHWNGLRRSVTLQCV